MEPRTVSATKNMILFVAAMSYFLAGFVTTSVNVALPAIQGGFKLSAGALGWVSLTYLLTATAVLIPLGKIGDLVGRKRVFVWGCLVFALASGACAFATSYPVLLGFRIVQGAGAGMTFATGPLKPQTAGAVLIVTALLQCLLSPLAGRLSDRLQPRWMASSGMGLVSACSRCLP